MKHAISTVEVIDLVTSTFGRAAAAMMNIAPGYQQDQIVEQDEPEVARLLAAARAVIDARKTHKSKYVSADLFAELEIAANEWSDE